MGWTHGEAARSRAEESHREESGQVRAFLAAAPLIAAACSCASPTKSAAPEVGPSEAEYNCAQQAERTFKGQGFRPNDLASYTSHLSRKSGRCYLLMQSMADVSSLSLVDAVDGTSFGLFAQRINPITKPLDCRVLPFKGSDVPENCVSRDEFMALVDPYMRDGGPRPIQ